ncbi:hypothetical protein RHMOL_Rhmol01G0231200 [Rhododendron molle]|uniref:Uncharacterized protein n=1 Tax=Rhododendron molle TaxID=49168 RepID=A0ACC0Q502_RHOML|nr:hypothetical protein RHMOL_Rhmol01G0231200 [Rhododendron molle]
MGGRFVIVTFPDEEMRNKALEEKWFEELKPWNGDQAKDERLVWIACYGMPLNAWNMPAFRSIGSIWGHFLEVDEETLKEVSFDKGKVLIATENTSKISDKIQFIVDG